MADAAINRRKSQLFLTNISPVYDTFDEVVKKKLKKGKFIPTKTGTIKMTSMCFQLGGVVSWIVLGQTCSKLGITYSLLVSVSLGLIGQLSLFLIFAFGVTVRNPGMWINWDIAFNALVSILTIITAILSMNICDVSDVAYMSEALAICGASFSICGCAALFLLYRYVEDPEEQDQKTARTRTRPPDPRKSLFA